jgi:hypothetical protein
MGIPEILTFSAADSFEAIPPRPDFPEVPPARLLISGVISSTMGIRQASG